MSMQRCSFRHASEGCAKVWPLLEATPAVVDFEFSGGMASAQQVTGFKKTLATWAKDLGLTYARSMQLGGDGSVPIGFRLADALILSKIKARLGLDECKFGFTGAAPIRVDTLEYFGSLGLSINEIYGMSETCGACTASTDQAAAEGTPSMIWFCARKSTVVCPPKGTCDGRCLADLHTCPCGRADPSRLCATNGQMWSN